jgi:hypothetical protein
MADIHQESAINHVPICQISVIILPFISLLVRDITNVVHSFRVLADQASSSG